MPKQRSKIEYSSCVFTVLRCELRIIVFNCCPRYDIYCVGRDVKPYLLTVCDAIMYSTHATDSHLYRLWYSAATFFKYHGTVLLMSAAEPASDGTFADFADFQSAPANRPILWVSIRWFVTLTWFVIWC